jgi:hypothetical protein
MSSTSTPREKPIEVALPLEAINQASAREKSIRYWHLGAVYGAKQLIAFLRRRR